MHFQVKGRLSSSSKDFPHYGLQSLKMFWSQSISYLQYDKLSYQSASISRASCKSISSKSSFIASRNVRYISLRGRETKLIYFFTISSTKSFIDSRMFLPFFALTYQWFMFFSLASLTTSSLSASIPYGLLFCDCLFCFPAGGLENFA